MKVKIDSIPSKSPLKLVFDHQQEWYRDLIKSAEDPEGRNLNKKNNCELELLKQGDCVQLSGQFSGRLGLICSRCAQNFDYELSLQFNQTFITDPKKANLSETDFFRSSDDKEDIEMTFFNSDELDLEQLISEQIFLQRPFQPLCRENCQGLCLKCGLDLNSDKCDCLSNEKDSGTLYEALKDFKVSPIEEKS